MSISSPTRVCCRHLLPNRAPWTDRVAAALTEEARAHVFDAALSEPGAPPLVFYLHGNAGTRYLISHQSSAFMLSESGHAVRDRVL